jgi:hypothetical protein
LESGEFAGWRIACVRQSTCHALTTYFHSNASAALSRLTRVLRRRRSSKSELALPNQHQVANVNKRVWQIRENPNRIASENEVNAHEHTSGNAPVPERDWDNAFALSFGGEPLDEETHREKSISNETKDHEVTPIQSKKSVFFPDPGNSDECKCVHRQLIRFSNFISNLSGYHPANHKQIAKRFKQTIPDTVMTGF